MTSFLGQCPSLEFIKLSLPFPPQPRTPPPRESVRLNALNQLDCNQTASTCGLLDQLILPKCEVMVLNGWFTDEAFDQDGRPAARIHPSSIDHLPVTGGNMRAVAMPSSCVLSGPNGCLRFCFFRGYRDNFDARFFTSLYPIPVSEIRELLVGTQAKYSGGTRKPWKQSADRVCGAFEMLKKVEDLTIVNCEAGPFFAALGSTADGIIIHSDLRRLKIYVGRGHLDIPALTQCAEARFENSRPLGEVTIVFENQPGAGVALEMESLKEFR